MSRSMDPRFKISIRGDFLGTSGDQALETNTLKVAAELKRVIRKNEWNHRVKIEAINRYSQNGNGVEIIVLPMVKQYCNLVPEDVSAILHEHVSDPGSHVNTDDPTPVT